MFAAFVLIMNLVAAAVLFSEGNAVGFNELGNLFLGLFLVLSCIVMLWTREDVDEILPEKNLPG